MKKSAKITLITVSVIIILIGLSVGFFFILIEPNIDILGTPKLDTSLWASSERTVTLLDINGKPLDDVLYDKNKIYVKLSDLPDYTPKAFIAIEDRRFYKHSGVDYKRILGAALSNIKSGKFSEGASTITQQLIKNTHLSNEKTIKRKLNEIRLARKLERIYSKDDILEGYLNMLYFGSGIHGIGTASRVMFGQSASELSIAQSAALASIINNPSRYNPYTNKQNLDKRTKIVLKTMKELAFITDDEYRSACRENVVFSKNKQSRFINGLIKSVCAQYKCREKELFLRHITLKTAYDGDVACAVRDAVSAASDKVNGYIRVIVLDNKSGGVVCDETNTNDYIDTARLPASAIKPFISYAPALENGKTPLTQILDEPTTFDGGYAPHNYKNIYRGYCSLRDCLIKSSNIAAVKLLDETGIRQSKEIASRFGIVFEPDDNSLALALGGMKKGVRLLDLANAYRTLANGGVYSPADYIIDDRITMNRRAVSSDTAYLITDMLCECAKYGTAKKLATASIIAAKTGTNGDENGNLDCYCIAYTPQNTIAVWYGAKSKTEPIKNSITGASCCEIIKSVCNSGAINTNTAFDMPDTVAYYEIDDKTLRETHEVYLADPLLPKRYRRRELLSKRHLPIRKNIDIIDYFDRWYWDGTLPFAYNAT